MISICGDILSTDALQSIPVRRPDQAGVRWQGLSHHRLATTLQASLHERGIAVRKAAWTVARKGQALFGGLDLQFPAQLGIPELTGMEYAMGVRHANDLSMSIQFFAGLRVMLCSNGVATGSFILARKHTCGIDLQEEVRLGVERLIAEARQAGDVVHRLKERRLTSSRADHLLCEAGRRRLLSWGHLGLVEAEYRKPAHDAFRDRNGWSLYNAFNHIAKRVSPARQLTALDRFRDLVLAA